MNQKKEKKKTPFHKFPALLLLHIQTYPNITSGTNKPIYDRAHYGIQEMHAMQKMQVQRKRICIFQFMFLIISVKNNSFVQKLNFLSTSKLQCIFKYNFNFSPPKKVRKTELKLRQFIVNHKIFQK
eukprot:TRINITY_DN29459_c1_g1_i1.p2 TRINITY_DN29459_c1_g1~~TRINITY_DN29459_c1_g1_i1.p2  ORF type:complete len:126 (+),score=4.52 TRINITY_DN29459_c1_g1_i1:139-516(+)